ncbi:MAG TPA: hypothetical protein VFL60_00160 [Gaiellaceae bacterium]|nr:hypothetical protein [Gaiellaceae bacterium]
MRIALVTLVLLVLLLPASAQADTGITVSCNGAPCSADWYTTNVHVSFILPDHSSNPQGCGDQDITQDTGGQTLSCSVVVSGSQCCRLDVTIKRDATPPTATAVALARAPDVGGWYNHPVGVTTSGTDALSGIASCTSTTYAGPDAGSATVSGTCRDNAGNVSAPLTTTFAYDATPPSVTGATARGADAGDWFNHPVAVAFSGSDSVSGVDSCTSTTYSGPDSGGATVSGSCRDKAGNTGTATVSLKYDSTPPSVTGATPARAPDADGWYNHALGVAFAGTDATSGIASCDAPTYDHPDAKDASVTGRCTDNAGNVSAPSTFPFQYDSTPPTLRDLLVTASDHSVALAWKASTDVTSVKVLRARGGAAPVTLFSGKRVLAYTDRTALDGNRYTYTIEALDVAGNVATTKTTATPSAPLIAPRESAHVSGGVLLRWRATKRAAYYNVQIWHGGRKVVSVWPAGTSYRTHRLAPGRYTWVVWPGFGARSRHEYGAMIGKSSFVVSR